MLLIKIFRKYHILQEPTQSSKLLRLSNFRPKITVKNFWLRFILRVKLFFLEILKIIN